MQPKALSTLTNSDYGIFPFILTLIFLLLIVVVGFVVWEIFISKKHSHKTTVITVTDEEETEPDTVNSLEDINSADETN